MQKKKLAKRFIAMCLVAALLLTLIILPPGSTAEAAVPSLPYIETLRARMKLGSNFKILEILSDYNRPSGIGYYIPQNEPSRLENDPDFILASDTDARNEAAKNWEIRTASATDGIYGQDQNLYPLDIADYAEAKYWDSHSTYPSVLTLPNFESEIVTGTRTDAADGAYKTTYVITIDHSGGNQILSGGHLVPATPAHSGDTPQYYYDLDDVIFVPITESTVYDPALAGSAVYGKTTTATSSDYIFIDHYAPGVITTTHAEIYKDGGIFLVTENDAPTSLTYSHSYYELIGATEIPQSGGYLLRKVDNLTLVDSGGDCNFTASSSGEDYEIFYNKIRYSGGFVNHNWFSRFVLDAEPADIPHIQYDISTHLITDIGGFSTEQFADYDLIVIGNGVPALPSNLVAALSGAGTDPVSGLFIEPVDAIIGNFGGASARDTAGNGNFVFGNLYFYTPTPSDAPGFDSFVSPKFHEDFSANISGHASGLKAVLDDINRENDLRGITGAPQLDNHVSIATSLRYILNQHQPRIVYPLSHVRILEIQPLYVATNDQGTPGQKFLFADDVSNADNPLNVLSWLKDLEITDDYNNTNPVTSADVTITRMSTAEFNGKIEDLNESYELIYFGDSRANFNLTNEQTDFTDDSMDGLLYYNIGEPIVKTDNGTDTVYKAAGLLDSDWFSPTIINKNDNTATLRLPGNDISSSKQSELEDYMNAGYPLIFAEDLVSGGTPNTKCVDRWTNLHQFMESSLAKNNVFGQSDISGKADGKRHSLYSFITLSKPAIIFTDNIPTPYTNDGSGLSENHSGRLLQYGFEISDPADPTPVNTTYNLHLYIDANASGKYTVDERINFDVYTADKQSVKPASSGYRLYSDTEYLVEALLPSDIVGIVPWKLEIVKNVTGGGTARYFHGSKTGYTRIRPDDDEKRTLNVLQIVGWDQYHQANMDDLGTTIVLETSDLYNDLTSGLEDFEIKFNTIRNNGSCYQYHELGAGYNGDIYRPMSMKDDRNDLWDGMNFNENDTGKTNEEYKSAIEHIYKELMYYDMLVIGFADCYEGIYDTLAYAILRYIESDRAVLFTHDTTSLNNMPYDVYMSNKIGGSNGDYGYWGYSFNRILRPAVGLDYYGISDPEFRNNLAKQTATHQIGSGTIKSLKAAGYNIAYKPNHPNGNLEEKTHGYNTYYFKEPDLGYRTQNVTQINDGQITTYPYNVNLAGFPNAPSDAASMLSVAETHFQYYTLNMNSDDLVVWYALADDSSGKNFSSTADTNGNYYHSNDAANGYYIYTMGNITYSGVGHNVDVTEDEAKLFVNTMIAAYRSSAINAEVTAKDKNNNNSSYLYFPADILNDNQELMIAEAADSNNEMFAAYFSFVNPTIKGGIASTSTASYYYSIGSADNLSGRVSIPDALTYSGVGNDSASVSTIESNQLYHFYIPNDVFNLLAEHNVLRIYFEVTTKYDNGDEGIGYDSIELRKIGLLPLQ